MAVHDPSDRERLAVADEFEVSHETLAKLDALLAELRRWQQIKKLVSAGDIAQPWWRHIADSLQLNPLAPPGDWLDLGSGAGFPGLVIAILRSDAQVHLVEANDRKCAFLRHAARLLVPNAVIHPERLEHIIPTLPRTFAIVSARALAPLPALLYWTAPLLKSGAVGLFPKGKDYARELTEARKFGMVRADIIPSRTDSDARILRIQAIEGFETA